jgi:hypothetical protein
MKTTISTFLALVTATTLAFPVVSALAATDRGKVVSMGEDGSVCYEMDLKDARDFLNKLEATESAGKLKEAFDIASGPKPDCLPSDGYDRVANVVLRTYKPLGEQAEKAGHLLEAHEYFIYPFDHYISTGGYGEQKGKYSVADANRTMLAYAKANPDDYAIMRRAIEYFERWWEDEPPEFEEAKRLVVHGGERLLGQEEKTFAAHNYDEAFEVLKKAADWFNLVDDEQPANNRATERSKTLLADGSYDAVEKAFRYYYQFSNLLLDEARARADQLGVEAESKGQDELAERFYSLAGDDERSNAIRIKMETAQKAKEEKKAEAEAKRRAQFDEDQKALEDELGI